MNINVRTIEAHRGWSGNKVRKVNKSVATSIVGSNTLNRKNFSNANILKVKKNRNYDDESQSWFLHVVIVKGQRVTAVAILAIPVIMVILVILAILAILAIMAIPAILVIPAVLAVLAIPAILVIIAILTRLTVLQFEYYFTEFPAHIVILSTLRRHKLRRFPAVCRPMFLSLLASSCLVCPVLYICCPTKTTYRLVIN